MEKENKNINWTAIIITIIIGVVVLAGIYSFYNQNNNQPQNTNTSAEPSVQSSATQPKTQTLTQTPQSQCDTAAKNYFNDYKSKQNDTATRQLSNISYQNHYNQNNGSCYVLTNTNWNMKMPSEFNYSMISDSLIDIFKKDPTGQYDWIGQYSENIAPGEVINGIRDCNVGGNNCSSLKDFLTLANPYLGK